MFIWAFFRLPEPKGRTYAELDILFATKTPARKFASTHVDPYAIGPSPSKEGLVRNEAAVTQERKE
jgi:SP family general alpha glucoside:H+ symporter-like MFS transporter